MAQRCSAIVDGRPCQAFAVRNSSLCFFHSPKPDRTPRPDHPGIVGAFLNPGWFGPAFPKPETWSAWFVFLKALFGEPMDEDELVVFRQCTGLEAPRPGGYREVYSICGRRSGKSRISAYIAAYTAVLGPFSEMLSAGERAWIFVIATDRQQAGVVFGYIKALLTGCQPDLVQRESSDELHLSNGISICVKTASFRAGRGYSTALIILDELAFLRNEESVNPASDIIASLLPGRMKGAKLLGISTPYSKSGYLYDCWKQFYGKESKVLIWKAGTRLMNSTLDDETIADLLERDPVVFGAELNAEWRDDISSFIDEGILRACMCRPTELPDPDHHTYLAFVDPSGGKSDSMTLAIGHLEGNKAVVSRVEEWKSPFDPKEVVASFANTLKAHRVTRVTSDRYGGIWVEDAFRIHGITTMMSDLSASQLYIEFQALTNMGRVQLLQDDELTARQFLSLERRCRSGGQDSVDHPEGLHDDRANVVAGCAVTLAKDRPWDEKEQEAHLPQQFHSLPASIAWQRKEDREDEMRRFFEENGERVSRIVRR